MCVCACIHVLCGGVCIPDTRPVLSQGVVCWRPGGTFAALLGALTFSADVKSRTQAFYPDPENKTAVDRL